MKILGIDIDGTIAHSSDILLKLATEQGLPQFRDEDIKEYDLDKFLSISKEDTERLFIDTWKQYHLIKPFESDIADKLTYIKKRLGWQIHIISNTFKGSEIHKIEWLKRWSIPFDAVTIISVNPISGYNGHTPMGAISRNEMIFDVLVDDSPINIERIHPSVLPIIYDRPYNRHIQGIRINTFSDLIKLLEKRL